MVQRLTFISSSARSLRVLAFFLKYQEKIIYIYLKERINSDLCYGGVNGEKFNGSLQKLLIYSHVGLDRNSPKNLIAAAQIRLHSSELLMLFPRLWSIHLARQEEAGLCLQVAQCHAMSDNELWLNWMCFQLPAPVKSDKESGQQAVLSAPVCQEQRRLL